ncbi:hypothetical protein DVH24_030135 [Malus domestica]|uniref:Uncharacterized protein n=1 Tax=Malus domestica TaxID=3750 RepID=A0A498HZ55_MALDO|nr:hypothetical protein DVH24_030135 [Malus domestica]
MPDSRSSVLLFNLHLIFHPPKEKNPENAPKKEQYFLPFFCKLPTLCKLLIRGPKRRQLFSYHIPPGSHSTPITGQIQGIIQNPKLTAD